MPTYDYLCQTCSHRFETWQKMTDEPLTTCPECGSHIRRVLYPAGVVFKGPGFYKTDHSSTVASATNGNGKKAETTDGSASSSHGESKTSSETSSNTGTAASNSNSASNTNSSENKAKTPAATK